MVFIDVETLDIDHAGWQVAITAHCEQETLLGYTAILSSAQQQNMSSSLLSRLDAATHKLQHPSIAIPDLCKSHLL